jgi:hypothetical protein
MVPRLLLDESVDRRMKLDYKTILFWMKKLMEFILSNLTYIRLIKSRINFQNGLK